MSGNGGNGGNGGDKSISRETAAAVEVLGPSLNSTDMSDAFGLEPEDLRIHLLHKGPQAENEEEQFEDVNIAEERKRKLREIVDILDSIRRDLDVEPRPSLVHAYTAAMVEFRTLSAEVEAQSGSSTDTADVVREAREMLARHMIQFISQEFNNAVLRFKDHNEAKRILSETLRSFGATVDEKLKEI